ncbi:hypothetical protein BGZ94_006742, partial [Podila epigama]
MDDVQAHAVETAAMSNDDADATVDDEPFTVVAAPNAPRYGVFIPISAFSGTTAKARRKHLEDVLKPLVVRVGGITVRDLRVDPAGAA